MIGQLISTRENYPLLFLSDVIESKPVSHIILQKFIQNAPQKFKYVSFEMSHLDILDPSNLVKEFDRVFPSNDLSWIKQQLNLDQHFIIFDSISSFIFRYGTNNSILFLSELLERKNNLLCVIHQDAHSVQDFEKILHLSNSLISTTKTHKNFLVKVFSQKSKAKLVSLETPYKIDKGELIPIVIEKEKDGEKNKGGERELSQQEEDARANTQLPYLKTSDEQVEVEEIYIEDPDDDLDI